ncbi:TPA: hypothetical protein EYO12_03845 [Candidatus Saccharibacteria bacterium]|nr:hypothetical protein [Candidatus Saccharibacteria bacterium]HIO87828.1 hypothetical protein [Candidatus Saccharibacteria bacterium]
MHKLLSILLATFIAQLFLATPVDAARFDGSGQGVYRYQEASGDPYRNIVDSQGNIYTSSGNNFVCLGDGGISAADRYVTDLEGDGNTEFACPGDIPASFFWINGSSSAGSVLYVDGQLASLRGLKANQGFPIASFFASESGEIVERVNAVVIGGANADSALVERENYAPYSPPYRYTNDDYTTVVDSQGRNFQLVTNGDCPVVSPESNQAGIFPNNSVCDNDRLFIHRNGNFVSFIKLPDERPHSQPLDQGADLAEFTSFNSNTQRLYDYISFFVIDAQFSSEVSDTFDDRCIQEVGILSWILCPIVNFTIDKVVEPIQDVVLDILDTDSLLTAPATGNNSVYIYNAWKQFRNIANVLLAVAFIGLIYLMVVSQSGTYSIQRTVPRLVVITIMIQVSYFIAAIMVDMGNVAAEGIATIFNSVRNGALQDIPVYGSGSVANALPSSADFLSLNSVDKTVGAGLGVILAIMGAFFYTWFVPGVVVFFIFGLLISILGVFLALVLRQLIIVVLIVLAPIAFILGLFPATEKWMREWFDNLGKLIVIYPLIAMVFGAGSLLSYLALGTGQSEVNMLIGSAIGLIVLFAIPILFSFAGRLFKGFTNSITNLTARSRSAAQGDANNPLSWKSNINYSKAERQMQVYDKAGRALPISRRFLRPSWKSAHVFNAGTQRMQGVVSATHPMNLRRLYWGDKPFKSLASYANWKNDHIKSAKPFEHEIKNITKSTPMLYSTLDAALQDTGFLLDRGINYTYGIGRMYKDGEIDRGTAELLWQAYHARVKSQGHRPFFGFASPDVLLDYDHSDSADLGGKWFAKDLNQISDTKEREAIFRARQSSLEDFGNAGTEREAGSSWRYVSRWLGDDAFLNEMIRQPNNQRNINAIDTLKRKADTMNVALNDPTKRAELIARMQQMGGDDDKDGARVGGYGQSGQGIRHMEEFVKQANYAYNYMQSRGVQFTDEINEFNF